MALFNAVTPFLPFLVPAAFNAPKLIRDGNVADFIRNTGQQGLLNTATANIAPNFNVPQFGMNTATQNVPSLLTNSAGIPVNAATNAVTNTAVNNVANTGFTTGSPSMFTNTNVVANATPLTGTVNSIPNNMRNTVFKQYGNQNIGGLNLQGTGSAVDDVVTTATDNVNNLPTDMSKYRTAYANTESYSPYTYNYDSPDMGIDLDPITGRPIAPDMGQVNTMSLAEKDAAAKTAGGYEAQSLAKEAFNSVVDFAKKNPVVLGGLVLAGAGGFRRKPPIVPQGGGVTRGTPPASGGAGPTFAMNRPIKRRRG